MSQSSLPSKEVCSVDVPEPAALVADFQYNYFSADEGVAEVDTTSVSFQDAFTSGRLDETRLRSRVPRYVKLGWQTPGVRPGTSRPGLISSNLKKILSETDLTSNDYLAILFADTQVDAKVNGFVSSSYTVQGTTTSATNVSDFNIVTAGRDQLQSQFGVSFFDANGIELGDDRWDALKSVGVLAQLNTRLAGDMVQQVVDDPHSQYSDELRPILKTATKLSAAARAAATTGLSKDDFKTYIDYYEVTPRTSTNNVAQSGQLIGYIIDKVEYRADGTTITHDSFVIEDGGSQSLVDFRVRYGATYAYVARGIYNFTLPAIDDDNGSVSLVSFLVSSRPSNKRVVRCIELVAPPPPADVGFMWNYETAQLQLHWNLPVNPQRDIKGFQVFRRASVDTAFQLLADLRFNDAELQDDTTIHAVEEGLGPQLVVPLPNERCYYIDRAFKKSSRFIYTVVSVDAHGLTSGYGVQYEVGFDVFKNTTTLKHISHSGAPKQYPNMYLQEDMFEDTVQVSGPSSKHLKVYWNPEMYAVVDNQGMKKSVISTLQEGGKYVFQFINTDKQEMTKIDVTLDDRRTAK